jgi:hypothetical protein
MPARQSRSESSASRPKLRSPPGTMGRRAPGRPGRRPAVAVATVAAKHPRRGGASLASDRPTPPERPAKRRLATLPVRQPAVSGRARVPARRRGSGPPARRPAQEPGSRLAIRHVIRDCSFPMTPDDRRADGLSDGLNLGNPGKLRPLISAGFVARRGASPRFARCSRLSTCSGRSLILGRADPR